MAVVCVRKERESKLKDIYRSEIVFSIKSGHKIFAHATRAPAQMEIALTFPFGLPKKRGLREKRWSEIDDTQSRSNMWRALFGDEQIPLIEKNAVAKYAGMLDKYISRDLPIEKIVERVKKS